ncbi:MAG: hypothetical protein HZA49_09295 [Planctomycetes bacterium]|nr:hypothetical protein [Planctomycetota bacterium]
METSNWKDLFSPHREEPEILEPEGPFSKEIEPPDNADPDIKITLDD